MDKIIEELKDLLNLWDTVTIDEIQIKMEEIENEATYGFYHASNNSKDIYLFISRIMDLSKRSMIRKILCSIESFRFKSVIKSLIELCLKLIDELDNENGYIISIKELSANQIEQFIKLLWTIRVDIIFIHNEYMDKIDTSSPFSVEEIMQLLLNLIKGKSSYFWKNIIIGYFNII